jgi:hypothetical protein
MSMVRNWFINSRLLLASLFALVVLVSCAAAPVAASTAQPVATVAEVDDGVTPVEPVALASALEGAAQTELTAAEVSHILYMREEEKLARDVYLTLYEKWGLPVFQNIAQSEETHMAAIDTLIDRYGLVDPATDEVGTFTNPDLQALYDRLIEQGYRSVVDALRVGAAIEEIDILDLQEAIEGTDHADIALVYGNLARGSENHLRAFVTNLARRGDASYAPQYLSQAAYDAIIGSQEVQGRGRRPSGNTGWWAFCFQHPPAMLL